MATEASPHGAAEPRSRPLPALRGRELILPLSIAAAVFWLAFDRGSFGVSQWTSVAVVVWWTIVGTLALGLWPRRQRIPVVAWTAGGLLTAYAVWTGLSALWAAGTEAPFVEMDRALLFVGVLALTVLAGGRRHINRWSDGLAVGIAAIAVLAVASRLFPGLVTYEAASQFLPEARTRLSYPIGYWNGLAILVALAVPLLLRIAVAARSATARGLALAPLPTVVLTIFLASSRTGAAACVVGTAAFVALAGRRWTAAGAAVVGGAAAIAAVVFAAGQKELVDGPLTSAAAADQGRRVALVIVLLGLAAATVHAFLSRALRDVSPPAWLGRLAAGTLAAALVAGVFAADPVRRWENFTEPPPADLQADVESHFLSLSGNWRWQYWQSAIDAFQTRPWLGRGAGSYEEWWAEHGTVVGFVGNAHSLYFETLGELGPIGLILIVGALVLAAGAAVRRASTAEPEIRDGAGAVAAALLAFLVSAGSDWIWKLPAVAVVGAILLGLAVGPGAPVAGLRPPSRARVRAQRTGLLVFAVAVLAAQTILWGAERKLQDSRDAVGRGDHAAAVEAAESARRLEPWAASPYLQLALVNELRGRLGPARAYIHQAVDRERDDWRLWLISARIEAKSGEVASARRSLARARTLNPRSPVFVFLGSNRG